MRAAQRTGTASRLKLHFSLAGLGWPCSSSPSWDRRWFVLACDYSSPTLPVVITKRGQDKQAWAWKFPNCKLCLRVRVVSVWGNLPWWQSWNNTVTSADSCPYFLHDRVFDFLLIVLRHSLAVQAKLVSNSTWAQNLDPLPLTWVMELQSCTIWP